ncbi:hypothetical protein BDF20DRAFT_888222 [Mycotypha africana]|uniref:uncharacterized protein n=1 Tax=Mycotypha africana TaxID=64632 RepID=UPI0023018302|nr:uncharacterized protein BDF20DRAFT_888222 [Mycotypha africana]KAI8972050.1 hypothetical protein BDF20DRAFT_888222 [Mycotypha africana]
MCFCLRRANRLIPNRFSFPLVERAFSRQPARGFYDLGSEEEEAGLLNSYSDSDTEHNMEDAELIDNQNALQITSESTDEGARRSKSQASEEEEEEEFSELQSH